MVVNKLSDWAKEQILRYCQGDAEMTVAFVGSESYNAEFQSVPRRGTIKNGFVGRMPHVYGVMHVPNCIDLKPSEWRRE